MPIDTIMLICLFAVSMIGSPGPANMALMAAGARYGYRKSVPFILGTNSGFFLVGVGVAAGLGTLFELFPAMRITFLFLSAAYILYLAYKIAFQAPKTGNDEAKAGYWSGIFIHPLNPKAWAMLITAYTQFSSQDLDPIYQFIIIQSIFQTLGLILNSMWCYGGDLLNRLVSSPLTLQWINRGLATLMIIIVAISVWQSGLLTL